MLDELIVENLGVIESARLDLTPGMTVITGETGAGKTMVVGAISFVTGAKADSRIIRQGSTEASVQARFVLDDEEIILARTITTSGKAKAYVNGRAVSLAEVQKIANDLLDIHGQHTSMRLSSLTAQSTILDNYAGVDHQARRDLLRRLTTLKEQLQNLEQTNTAKDRELAAINFELNEIDSVKLLSDTEDDELHERLDTLEKSEEFRAIYADLLTIIDGGDDFDGSIHNLNAITRRMVRLNALSSISERLLSVSTELGDISSDVKVRLESIDVEPQIVDQIRSRLVVLRDIKKRFGPTLSDVLRTFTQLKERRDQLLGDQRSPDDLRTEILQTNVELDKVLRAIGELRKTASVRLAPVVNENLGNLSLAGSDFFVHFEDSPDGSPLSFQFSPNKGQPPIEVAKFASGGELSRMMLALTLAIGATSETQVFDEIDQGIGGKTGIDVGASLAKLARKRQVIVVTHLAQVAVFGNQHFTITKNGTLSGTTTSLVNVTGEQRVTEIARMLSGVIDLESARIHARELLQNYSPNI